MKRALVMGCMAVGALSPARAGAQSTGNEARAQTLFEAGKQLRDGGQVADAFGFERDHYEISMRVGERVLLPKVRGAAPDTLIVADGFSCREQIVQATGRQALHLSQVLQMALHRQ